MNRLAFLCLLGSAACFSKPAYHDRDAGTGDGAMPDAPDPMPSDAPPKIAAGQHHACAIDADSRLWCWGNSNRRQLGEYVGPPTGQPQRAFAGAMELGWTTVSAGFDHTCGIRNGTLYCWGNDDFDQAGGKNPPNLITLTSSAVRVIAGARGTCAIDTMKHIKCWGVIDPTTGKLPAITQIGPTQLEDWANVSLGTSHACAITTSGKVACWGHNDNRQLGNPNPGLVAHVDSAQALAGTFLDVAANEAVTCGITASHQLGCIGSSAGGLMGTYQGSDTELPIFITPNLQLSWSRISLGYNHACGITSSGVYCYGSFTDTGAVGDGFFGHGEPRKVALPSSLGAVSEVVSGQDFSCARDVTGHVACWGSNQYGETGDGKVATTTSPQKVALGLAVDDQVTAVSAGNGHTCALVVPMTGNATVKCWGDNRARQVDSTGALYRETPAVSQLSLKSISSGESHTCGVTTSGGNITCWGANGNGQLTMTGNGTIPVPPPAGATWVKVAAGSTTTCAITDTSKLYCWGSLIPTDTGDPLTPTLKSATGDLWTDVAIGSQFGVGIHNGGGTLGGFGDSCKYGLNAPNGVTYLHNAPGTMIASVAAGTTFVAAQSQGDHACAMVPNGGFSDIICWGSNASFQLGGGSGTTRCEPDPHLPVPPVQVRWAPAAQGRIAAANQHTCAVGHDGTTTRLYCWGYDPGYLGFGGGMTVGLASGTLTAVTQVATGPHHICVIGRGAETQDQVYCWGKNRTGEVGNGARFHDTPVPVSLVP